MSPLRLTVRFIFVLVLFGLLFSYAMFQGGFVSWFLFFSFLPVLLYSVYLAIYPMNWSQTERKFSKKYAEAGQDVEVEITFRRLLPLPLFYIIVEDQLPEEIMWKETREKKYQFLSRPSILKNRSPQKTIIFPWFKRTVTFRYILDHIPRGSHHFSQVKMVSGDFLGMIKKERVLSIPSVLHVKPWGRSLKQSNEMSTFDEGKQTAFSPQIRHTNMVAGVRDYAPGDRFSWVDWKTTAKKQKLTTKEFEQEKHKDLTVMLNGIAPANRWLAFEASVEIGHALVHQSLRLYGNVQMIFAGKEREEILLTNRKRSTEQLIQFLTSVRLVEEGSFYEQLTKEAIQRSQERNLLIVSSEINQQIGETLIRLHQQGREVAFIFIAGKNQLQDDERAVIHRMKQSPVSFSWLKEEDLMRSQIEVNA